MPLESEEFLSALTLTDHNPLDEFSNLSQQIKRGNFNFLEIKIFYPFFLYSPYLRLALSK